MNIGPYFINEVSFQEISQKLNPEIDAAGVTVQKTKVDMKNDRYHFSATSGGPKYQITIWVKRPSGKLLGKKLQNADIKCSCSCPAFLYQGSDYNAVQLGILDLRASYRRPKSNGIAPNIRDPERKNLVCKHIVACFQRYKDMYV